jgi:rare lipoprotein A
VVATEEGRATWYDPPAASPPVLRAPGEFTAAYDKLPMDTAVRVTNLANGRSVVVRITDRGVRRSKVIDLCKEAADEIGLIGKGETKVRMERLEE